ncbi:hypothetical protein ACFSDD_09030 [Salipiger marinus]|uniref:hypothetical protein n=1 Tax=Salipiger marinus TaxID=555512 RepID=UPI002B608BC8|nr:hypothetical protein [Salipiger manganoxidans]MEB3421918.1 hypothetical protein [Salipiger manganoxidans]
MAPEIITCQADVVRPHAEACPVQNMAIAATTHGSCDRHLGADTGAEAPKPRVYISSLRAAWVGLKVAERRFSDSIWGDALATACVVLLSIVLFVVAGVLQ